MKIAYVAGPFRAENYWLQERNIRLAEEAALELWKMGLAVICPHANTRFFQGAAPDELWLAGDLEIMKRCDFVLMVGAWTASEGAKKEHEKALAWGIPIFYSTVELRGHLKSVGALAEA